MSVALAPRRQHRRRDSQARDYLIEGRGLRRALVAATRAGRSPMQIARQAGCSTRSVEQLLAGASFATPALAHRLTAVLAVTETKVVPDGRGGHLPYALLSPLVEQAVERHGAERAASLAGIPSRRLLALRSGETRLVRLDVADRIVIGLGSPILWWENRELRRWAHATTAHV